MPADKVFDSPEKVYDYMLFYKAISPQKVVFVSESSRDGLILSDLFKNIKDVNTIYANGKNTCLEASELAYQAKLKGCAALVDADFDNIKKESYTFPVILTDFHDLESYAIFSHSWDRILREILNIDKLTQLNIALTELREKCLDLCLPLGIILFINNELNLSIDFKDYCFGKKCKIDYQNYKNDVDNVIKRLKQLNAQQTIPEDLILKQYMIYLEGVDSINKCQYISSIMICKCLIELSKDKALFRKEVSSNTFNEIQLLRWFRSQIRNDDLIQTKMYKDVIDYIEFNKN